MTPPLVDHEQCLERHRPYLTLLARTHLTPRHAAKLAPSEVVQQTLLDADAKRDQYQGSSEADLAIWLREILKNNLAEGDRNQRRDRRRGLSLEGAIDESFSHTDQWLATLQSFPSQRAVNQVDLLRLSDALNELPDAQREAIVLHHLQGVSLSKVASEIGRSQAAVAGVLFRGLRTLRRLLDE